MALAGLGGNFHRQHFAAHFFDLNVMLQQFLPHAGRIGGGQIGLVDGDNDRHLGRLGVGNGLDRLRHDAVIGGDNQHHDVGDLRAARTHFGGRPHGPACR